MSRAAQIQSLLNQTFDPMHLEVKDVSHEHHTHSTEETHFTVIMVSEKFTHQSKVMRHKAVYQCLHTLMPVQNVTTPNNSIHALALHLFTPSEWEKLPDNQDLNAPKCRGGFHE